MSYRWRPSKSQRRAFAIRMQDPDEQKAYDERKQARAEKRRDGSSFDYESAGGNYKPTENQNQLAFAMLGHSELTSADRDAANQLIGAFSCNEQVHHDIIHVVNEFGRAHHWDGFRFNEEA